MNVNAAPPLTGLARRLVQDGILEEQVARSAVQDARARKLHFVAHVVESGLANSMRVESRPRTSSAPRCRSFGVQPRHLPKNLVDVKLVEKHRTIPLFKRGNRLYIAVSDPTNLFALDEIKFHTGISTEAVLVVSRPRSRARCRNS